MKPLGENLSFKNGQGKKKKKNSSQNEVFLELFLDNLIYSFSNHTVITNMASAFLYEIYENIYAHLVLCSIRNYFLAQNLHGF